MPESVPPFAGSTAVLGSFPERAERLASLASPLLSSRLKTFPLLLEYRLFSNLFTRLREAVQHYLFVNLINAFPEQNIEPAGDLLARHDELIKNLPNLTPNGLLLPKQENLLAYGAIHQAVAKVIEDLQIGPQIQSIHAPVNVRIVNGEPNPALETRPRATTKLHSDIWAGESTDAIMVFLPLFGDMAHIGIENIEPTREFLDYLRPLEDFSQGAMLERDATPYPVDLQLGCVYLTDPFLLHRTRKRRKGLRLSIDLRVRANTTVSSDVEVLSNRAGNYIAFEDWKAIGSSKLLVSDSSMFDFVAGREDAVGKNEYAAKFRLVDLKA